MSLYKINGYDLFTVFGIQPDADNTTADSFEAMNDVKPVETYDWPEEDGIEYDLISPVVLKPRVFVIKGTLFADGLSLYQATKSALAAVLYQQYVTLEMVSLGIKVNGRLQPGGMSWNRVTFLNNTKIVVSVQFRFDEIMQPVPFKDESIYSLEVNSNLHLMATTEGSIYKFSLDANGHLILTT